MKLREFKKYLSIFILAVLIIAVYKTFDNIENIFSAIGSFISLITPVIAAFAIAFLLYPMCRNSENFIITHFPEFFAKKARGLSVVAVYIFIFVILGGIFYLLLPTLITSVIDFAKKIPLFLENTVNMLNESKYFDIDLDKIDKYINFQKFITENLTKLNTYTSKIVTFSSGLIKAFLSIIASIYIILDREHLKGFALDTYHLFIPDSKRKYITKYMKAAIDFSYKYLFCVIMDAMIIFVVTLIILSVMKIQYAPVLAIMLGLFNIIPYFGAIVSCAVSVLITIMTANFSKAVLLAVILIALQQIDANVIQPHLINGKLSIRPFWVLVGIIIGGGLFGVWGILLAIPSLALIRTMINDYYDYRRDKEQQKQCRAEALKRASEKQ
ncbi:MAG: AI-2E family transporter [Clostridia bacterium]|nr:AI-2E family transporter [Clostridia bacterium]